MCLLISLYGLWRSHWIFFFKTGHFKQLCGICVCVCVCWSLILSQRAVLAEASCVGKVKQFIAVCVCQWDYRRTDRQLEIAKRDAVFLISQRCDSSWVAVHSFMDVHLDRMLRKDTSTSCRRILPGCIYCILVSCIYLSYSLWWCLQGRTEQQKQANDGRWSLSFSVIPLEFSFFFY